MSPSPRLDNTDSRVDRGRHGAAAPLSFGNEASLDRLLAAFGDIVVVRGLDGRILQANAAFAEVTGCDDPTGRPFLDFCAGAEGGQPPHDPQVLTIVTRDGPRPYDWREVIGRDPDTGAAIVHALGRRMSEQQVAAQDLIAGRDRAESASAAKSRFLAMVSHEVRTPLNGILGITELLARTRLTREQESYVDAVRHSGHALLSLIEDLLDFSSMEAGRFYLRPEAGNLHQLVGGIVELAALNADDKGIEIAAHIAPDVPEMIVADHGRLRQVLFNLVGNAMKFTESGGVLVEVTLRDGRLCLAVIDSGPGIGESDRKRIFEEFEQVENGPTRRKGGAGLGLAISARLVAAMDGALDVESDGHSGSTFTFDLPLIVPDGEGQSVARGARDLEMSRVLVVAPGGPTETALVRLIRDRGGKAEWAGDIVSAATAIAALGGDDRLTDMVVDNRFAAVAETIFSALPQSSRSRVGRTMMVTPQQREALTKAKARAYAAWLVRPLRPSSVIKVLRRETGGLAGWLEERREATSASDALRPATSKHSILLAEDNPVNALLVRSALTRAGHTVEHVHDGRSLLDLVCGDAGHARRFDLVLTDLSMPEMDGVEAIAAIRAFEVEQGLEPLPIVVLSADGQASTRERALRTGADDYVEKPVDPGLLLQTVERTAIQE